MLLVSGKRERGLPTTQPPHAVQSNRPTSLPMYMQCILLYLTSTTLAFPPRRVCRISPSPTVILGACAPPVFVAAITVRHAGQVHLGAKHRHRFLRQKKTRLPIFPELANKIAPTSQT